MDSSCLQTPSLSTDSSSAHTVYLDANSNCKVDNKFYQKPIFLNMAISDLQVLRGIEKISILKSTYRFGQSFEFIQESQLHRLQY